MYNQCLCHSLSVRVDTCVTGGQSSAFHLSFDSHRKEEYTMYIASRHTHAYLRGNRMIKMIQRWICAQFLTACICQLYVLRLDILHTYNQGEHMPTTHNTHTGTDKNKQDKNTFTLVHIISVILLIMSTYNLHLMYIKIDDIAQNSC